MSFGTFEMSFPQQLLAVAIAHDADPNLILDLVERTLQRALDMFVVGEWNADEMPRSFEEVQYNSQRREFAFFHVRRVVDEVVDPHAEISLAEARVEAGDEDVFFGDEFGVASPHRSAHMPVLALIARRLLEQALERVSQHVSPAYGIVKAGWDLLSRYAPEETREVSAEHLHEVLGLELTAHWGCMFELDDDLLLVAHVSSPDGRREALVMRAVEQFTASRKRRYETGAPL